MTHMEKFLPRPLNDKIMPFLKDTAYGREVVEASVLFARQYYIDGLTALTELSLEQSKNNGEKTDESKKNQTEPV